MQQDSDAAEMHYRERTREYSPAFSDLHRRGKGSLPKEPSDALETSYCMGRLR
jgi:hypothetical protein